MIVKILTRKDANFKSIIDYLYHDQGLGMDYSYLHNIDVDPDNRAAIVKAFKHNDQFRKKRANGISFYHEVLSFNPKDTAIILENPDLLRDITERYLRLRAQDALAVARPHLEKKDHIHIHFVISGNEKGSAKTLRMSKSEMEQIKRSIRQYQQDYFPELEHSYQSEKDYTLTHRRTHKSWQMDLRHQIQDRKAQLKKLLLSALNQANSWEQLTQELHTKDMAVYHRKGSISGVIWRGKKYRFSTLIKAEQTLEKVQTLNQDFQKGRENQYLKQLSRKGKTFGIPKLPNNWQTIKKDLEKMEQKEQLRQQQRTQEQKLDLGKDFDRLL